MATDEKCESLVVWLGTFPNLDDVPKDSASDLCDGIAIARCLTQIAPNWFDADWESKIKPGVEGNWRLKVSNLKKILKAIREYYEQILHQYIDDFSMPDLSSIGEKCDEVQLGRLLQLVLGCAVHCEKKEEYIQRIMNLEESIQHAVMSAIQELMLQERPRSVSAEVYKQLEEDHKDVQERIQSISLEKEELAQSCHELRQELRSLHDEHFSVVKENEELSRKLGTLNSPDDPNSEYGRRQQSMYKQLEQLKEEKFELESLRDDYRMKIEQLESHVARLQTKNEDLTGLAEKAQRWKDEVDEYRHEIVKYHNLESTLDSYKKKVEEMTELRKQVKALEQKNSAYMSQTLQLEDDLRKSASFKTQVDLYKKKQQKLEAELQEERLKYDKVSFDLERVTKEWEEAEQERKQLLTENQLLRDQKDEIDFARTSHAGFVESASPTEPSLHASFSAQLIPPDVESKIAKLERENALLKEKLPVTDSEQQVHLLESQLEDVHQSKLRLENELRTSNQKMYELESQLAKGAPTGTPDELQKSLVELRHQSRLTKENLSRREEELLATRRKLKSAAESLNSYKKELHAKDQEKAALEKKYKRYLDKARTVIESLQDGKTSTKDQDVQKILAEKDKIYASLEREFRQYREAREREERLIASAWYNMGMQLHRKLNEERLASATGGVSFLARQRHAASKRNVTVGSRLVSSDSKAQNDSQG
ncbi:protein Hook homolog 3-like [Oscarella lobularis]|uniref:protein Hook homolog 3-like n=1 Tax=Oscarella lobularis TaxID=121494 RepID=UPI0033139533